jgi:dynein heavy chain
MVTTFKLCSEQLSSQDHYDYGMRAVRSVINAAGLLKMSPLTAALTEDQLLLRALRDVNVPKFLKDDLPLFENIIKDLFPGVPKPELDQETLIKELSKQCLIS